MIVRDFVLAGRLLRGSPGFAITTVATIAMGIAASAVVFSVTNTPFCCGLFRMRIRTGWLSPAMT